MSSELIQLLEQEARVEKDKVLSEARARAEEILAAARREAEEIVAAARRRSEAERAQARTRASSAASLRASALLLEAKDKAIQGVFERAQS
jgi:vacuolar-type H+-ATPase subunit E/Vma4